MKLKISEILNIASGLDGLDGYEQVVASGNQKKVVKTVYQFASSKTSWNIAKNKRILRAHIEDYNEARNALIKAISGGGTSVDATNEAQASEFSTKLDELLKSEVEVEGILKIKLDELLNEKTEKADDPSTKTFNAIPASVLDGLFEVLIDEAK